MVKRVQKVLTRDLHFREMALQSVYSFLMRAAGLAVNYFFLIFVTKHYGATGWGIFAICFSIIQICSMVGTFGFNVAFVKIIPQGYSNIKALYLRTLKSIVPINILLNVLIYLLAPQFGHFFGADGIYIDRYIRVASFGILPFSISLINSGILRGNKEIILFSFFDSLGRFLSGSIIVAVLTYINVDPYNVIVGFVAGLYLIAILSFKGIRDILNRQNKSNASIQFAFADFIKLGMPIFWGTLAVQGSLWSSTIILGYYLSKEQVGVFDATNRLASLLTITLFAINSISAPKFAESNGDANMLNRNVQASSKLIFWTSVPLYLFLLFVGNWLLKFLEHAAINEYLIFVIILSGQLVNTLSGSVGVLMQMTGYHRLNQKISFCSLVFTAVTLFVVTPMYGLVGAAIVVGLNIALRNIVSVIMMYNRTKILTVYNPPSIVSIFKKSQRA